MHLGKTVAHGSFAPSLNVSLGVDHNTAIPGDPLTYHATLTNSGATATLTGDLTARNTDSAKATVASYWDAVATSANPGRGCPTNHGHDTAQWMPLVGAAANQSGYTPVLPPPVAMGMTLSLTPVPASGVSYPATGDRMLGTTLRRGAKATWHYVATIPLNVAQEGFLLDPPQVTKLRNTLHVEVAPGRAHASQRSLVNACFKPSLFGASPGTATGAKIVITPPTGAPVTFSAPSTAGLASLAPGASVTVSTPYKVPAVSAKGETESDSAYLARLHAIDGSALTANASASAESSGGPLSAKAPPVSTNEHLPVLAITKTGPSSIYAGTTIGYDLALKNSGSAQAASLAASDKASDGTAGTVSEVPVSLEPARSATADATLAVPSGEPPGDLTDTASVSWKDANGNGYGPIFELRDDQRQSPARRDQPGLDHGGAGQLLRRRRIRADLHRQARRHAGLRAGIPDGQLQPARRDQPQHLGRRTNDTAFHGHHDGPRRQLLGDDRRAGQRPAGRRRKTEFFRCVADSGIPRREIR